MKTIPVFIMTRHDHVAKSGFAPPCWKPYGKIYPDLGTFQCHDLTSQHVFLRDFFNDGPDTPMLNPDGITISPNPPDGGFSSWEYRYQTGSVTHDGDAAYFTGSTYLTALSGALPGNAFSSHIIIDYPFCGGVGQFVSYGSRRNYFDFSATVTQPISPTSTVRFELTFHSIEALYNGALFRTSADRAELRTGGIVQGFALSKTYETQAVDSVLDLSGASHTIAEKVYKYTGALEFPLSAQVIEVRLGDQYGQWIRWQTLNFKPQGTFQAISEDGEFALDASGVYVVGGTIRAGNGLRYTNPWFQTDEAIAPVEESSVSLYEDNWTVSLTAFSRTNCGTVIGTQTIEADASAPSALSDHDAVSYLATPSGNDIQIYEYKNGIPSEQAKYTLTNHKNGKIMQHSDDSIIYIQATDRADGERKLYASDDRTDTFDEVL